MYSVFFENSLKVSVDAKKGRSGFGILNEFEILILRGTTIIGRKYIDLEKVINQVHKAGSSQKSSILEILAQSTVSGVKY